MASLHKSLIIETDFHTKVYISPNGISFFCKYNTIFVPQIRSHIKVSLPLWVFKCRTCQRSLYHCLIGSEQYSPHKCLTNYSTPYRITCWHTKAKTTYLKNHLINLHLDKESVPGLHRVLHQKNRIVNKN